MRRLSFLLALALACLAPSAPAAAQGDEGGTITGVVTNGTTDEPQGDVTIRLLGGLQDDEGNFSQELEDTTTTDARGRFEFTDLPSGQQRVYTLDAAFDGGAFPGGVITIANDGDVIEVTQKVWNTTTDPRSIVIQNNRIFLLRGDEGASVIESFEIVNVSDEAYIGRGAGLAGPQNEDGAGIKESDPDQPVPSLSFSFPQDARRGGVQIVESDLDVPRLLDTETGIGITSAVPPDETTITFAYGLRVNTGQIDLSRRALYPTLNLTVLAEPPFVVDSTRLSADGDETIDGVTYTRYRSGDTITEGNSIPILAAARGDDDLALVLGAVAAAVVLALIVLFAFIRRRRHAPETRPQPTPDAESRDDLLVAIARIDLEYRNGKLEEEEWTAKRAKLKLRLARLKSPEPTP